MVGQPLSRLAVPPPSQAVSPFTLHAGCTEDLGRGRQLLRDLPPPTPAFPSMLFSSPVKSTSKNVSTLSTVAASMGVTALYTGEFWGALPPRMPIPWGRFPPACHTADSPLGQTTRRFITSGTQMVLAQELCFPETQSLYLSSGGINAMFTGLLRELGGVTQGTCSFYPHLSSL